LFLSFETLAQERGRPAQSKQVRAVGPRFLLKRAGRPLADLFGCGPAARAPAQASPCDQKI